LGERKTWWDIRIVYIQELSLFSLILDDNNNNDPAKISNCLYHEARSPICPIRWRPTF
jgi:hypothetical protein